MSAYEIEIIFNRQLADAFLYQCLLLIQWVTLYFTINLLKIF